MHIKHRQVQELGAAVTALRAQADDLFITAPADARVALLALAQRIEELPVYVDDDDLEQPADQPCHFAPASRCGQETTSLQHPAEALARAAWEPNPCTAPFQDDPATVYRSEF